MLDRRILRVLVVLLRAISISLLPCVACADNRPTNVVVIVADDMGYSDLGCFGSEISTPHLDSLAAQGVTFTSFYTAPTCSPTRAMLLTGVDHHLAGLGNMYEFLRSAPRQIGQPGYEGYLNDRVVTIAEVLNSAGYHTSISGKWHVGRRAEHSPAARGFDRSWVLLDGWAEHFSPGSSLPRFFRQDGRLVEYPQGKYSSEWFTDKAIEFVDEARAGDRPFFLVTSYTAPHWPLQAPPALIEKQRGKYRLGYDSLRQQRIAALKERQIIPADATAAPVPRALPVLHHSAPTLAYRPWIELSLTEQQYSARLMEVYAAMVESMDAEIGRLFAHLKHLRQFENTLVIFLSDNGAAPMHSGPPLGPNTFDNVGQPSSFVGYGPDWGRASTGPFRMLKGHASEGGIRTPCIVKLPGKSRTGWSSEFATVLDIAPTIYELVNATYPESFRGQPPLALNGASLLGHLRDQVAAVHSNDQGMGWELFGRTAYRKGQWKITWVEPPFGPGDFELFDILQDPGETDNLAATRPKVFAELKAAWGQYVRRTGVVLSRPTNWGE